MPELDLDKPMRVAGTHEPVRLLDPNYNSRNFGPSILIAVKREEGDTISILDKQGRPKSGGKVRIENVPQVSRAVFPLPPDNRRGLINLELALLEYPDTRYFVEIVSTDGIPTEALIRERTK